MAQSAPARPKINTKVTQAAPGCAQPAGADLPLPDGQALAVLQLQPPGPQARLPRAHARFRGTGRWSAAGRWPVSAATISWALNPEQSTADLASSACVRLRRSATSSRPRRPLLSAPDGILPLPLRSQNRTARLRRQPVPPHAFWYSVVGRALNAGRAGRRAA